VTIKERLCVVLHETVRPSYRYDIRMHWRSNEIVIGGTWQPNHRHMQLLFFLIMSWPRKMGICLLLLDVAKVLSGKAKAKITSGAEVI